MKCIQIPTFSFLQFLKAILFVYFFFSPFHSHSPRHKDDNNERERERKCGRRKKQFTIFLFLQYLTFFFFFFFFSLNRTIDHTICTFNLPTEFNASGQEHIIDDEDKVKIKVDPTKMSLDGIEIHQLEEIVDGWFKYIAKIFRDACEKVSNDNLQSSIMHQCVNNNLKENFFVI